ncbi:MAG TPA: helix-turn-helix transcriptional regulator, partial [Acidimicrobiia bacterium]|nr:helix-turn-helix transcriptional regulator [Acidimicrobiia bacterium]
MSQSKHGHGDQASPGERHLDVGQFIRQQRERADLSLRRLADRAGISNPYLSQIERGIRHPSAEILKRISRALSISAESLYSRAGLIEEGPTPPAVVDAIEADSILSPRQKQVMLDLYRTLVSAGT